MIPMSYYERSVTKEVNIKKCICDEKLIKSLSVFGDVELSNNLKTIKMFLKITQ